MEKYTHITEMEKIMDDHFEKIKELRELLDYLDDNMDRYNNLIEYYYSEQRQQDLKDDEAGLMGNLKRGVLSEDSIYDLISDYYECSVKMLELSTKYFKRN